MTMKAMSDEVKAMKTMKIHRFSASPFSALFSIEPGRILLDPERVPLAPTQRTLS